MPQRVTEATAPPSGATRLVCPRCRREPETFTGYVPSSGEVARCPDHGFAFIDALELGGGEDTLLGATFAGRFTILARLGRGSMGSVYRARQEAVGRDVAIKIVRPDRAYDPETKARFEREARAVSVLTSPHTVTAFDFGEAEDGSWFLVMEMLEGETLGERLKRVRRLHWRAAVRFVRHALLSLGEAHQKGIIHRDLKPDNLFISKGIGSEGRETCKILDFGIAKWMDGESGSVDPLETQAGTVFGTPRYMSPEQAQGAQLDARSDLYSLGVLFYQMLAGRAPFVDDDAVVVMARHIKDTPPPFSEVASDAEIPAAIERVLRRALAKTPADRPQNAEDFMVAIDAALEEAGSVASGVHTASVITERPAPPPRRLWLAGVALLLALLMVGSIWAVQAGLGAAARPAEQPIVAEHATAAIRVMPTIAPNATESATALPSGENSTLMPAPAASDASGGPPPAQGSAAPAPKRSMQRRPAPANTSELQRKGNERYGRFE
jgi:eukaryotic-like serine/threonine-protein kinase